MKKISLILLISLLVGLMAFSQVVSAEYPEDTVKLIIPYGPGGGTDTIFRIMVKDMEQYFGEPMVVINMPGAGATQGARYIKDSEPDGYKLLGSHDVISTAFHSDLSDFTFSAFEPICLLTSTPNILTVHADSQFDTVNELLDYAQENPGEIKWAYSPGGTEYFFFKGILKAADIDPDVFRQISIEGTGKQIQNLLGQHVDVILGNVASCQEYVKDDQLKYLAVGHDERLPQAPETPTFKEEGLDFVHSTDRGVFAPKGTSDEVINKVAEAFKQITDSEQIQNEIESIGSIVNYKGPEEYAEFVKELDNFYEETMD